MGTPAISVFLTLPGMQKLVAVQHHLCSHVHTCIIHVHVHVHLSGLQCLSCHFLILDEDKQVSITEAFTKAAKPQPTQAQALKAAETAPPQQASPVKKKLISAADFFGASSIKQSERSSLAVKRKAVRTHTLAARDLFKAYVLRDKDVL